MLAAGGKVVGKHMMNGFMGDYGKPMNPHDPERITGGSSSGSGAALAAGEVDISFGGDQGGSIRLPAAYCGVVGLKPTFGLVSHFAVGFAAEPSVDHVGPMARTVPDVAAALQAVAGYDDNDPRQRRGIPDSIDALSDLDGGVRGLRIGILEEGFAEPIEPGVAEGVLAAVADAGEARRRGQPDLGPAACADRQRLCGAGVRGRAGDPRRRASSASARRRTIPPRSSPRSIGCGARTATCCRRAPSSTTWSPSCRGATTTAAVYAKAHNVRPAYVAAFDRALAKVDVLALPTVRNIAPPVEEEPADPTEAILASLRRNWMLLPMAYNTKPTNYTGHPALAVPCGKVDGMPISLQLVGNFLADPLLLRVAYAYQKAVDWEAITGVG